MGKKVTIQQIADYLGVSKYVVSRALSGKSGVKDETRDKVIEAAKQLGYDPTKLSNMKDISDKLSHETGQKNVLVVLPRTQYQDSIYWGKIIDGISSELKSCSFGMVIITESDSLSSIINLKGIIGIICVGHISSNVLLEFNRWQLPIVLIDDEESFINTHSLFANNFDSSFQITNYLIGLGHQQLVFVGDIYISRSFYDRWLGFRSAIEENKLVPHVINAFTSNEVRDYGEMIAEVKSWFINKLKDRKSLPTAIVCANDSIALYVMKLLEAEQIKVPDEVSITGFDNIESSYLSNPTLTTIHVPKEQLGKRAVQSVLAQISHQNAGSEKVILSCELMIRESTSKPRI